MGPSEESMARLAALVEWNKPHWHRPVDLGIKGFKRFVRDLPISKKTQNFMIRRYKSRAWMEFEALPGPKGSFPTHPVYGTKVEVEYTEEQFDIKVKTNGQK